MAVCLRVTGVSSKAVRNRRSRAGRQRTAAGGRLPACGPASSGSYGHRGPEELRTERGTREKLNKCFLFCCVITKYVSENGLRQRWVVCLFLYTISLFDLCFITSGDELLTVSVTEARSRITEYTRPLLFIVT